MICLEISSYFEVSVLFLVKENNKLGPPGMGKTVLKEKEFHNIVIHFLLIRPCDHVHNAFLTKRLDLTAAPNKIFWASC